MGGREGYVSGVVGSLERAGGIMILGFGSGSGTGKETNYFRQKHGKENQKN